MELCKKQQQQSSSRGERGEERRWDKLGCSRPGPLSHQWHPRFSQMHHQLIDRTWTLTKETLMPRSHHRSRPLPQPWNCRRGGFRVRNKCWPTTFHTQMNPRCRRVVPEMAGVINPSSRRRTTPPPHLWVLGECRRTVWKREELKNVFIHTHTKGKGGSTH